jgi:GT2 family glycosyltransferase
MLTRRRAGRVSANGHIPDASERSLPARSSVADGKVTVVVPVRDDPEGIRKLLDSLERQTLPRDRFEIVIGDDGSDPRSLDGVATNGSVRVLAGPPKTSYAGRNRAAAAAAGDVLAFSDSDCLPDPAWLERGLAALEHADVVAGQVVFVAPAEPTIWSLLTIDMFLDQERNVLLSRGVTANLFVRRELFEAVGGFDETLPSGGDYDFVRHAVERGAELAYAPEAIVRHPTMDARRPFLQKIRSTNRWSGFRRARGGEEPDLIGGLTAFVPIVGVARARRNALRPALHLQRGRLRAAGVDPGWRPTIRALFVLYFVVAYVAGYARSRGWAEGRRVMRKRSHPGAPAAQPEA